MKGFLRLVAFTLLCAFCASGHSATMKAHFIDVGQGASTLLEFSCGTVLIDLGGETTTAAQFSSNQKLRAYLEKFFHDRPGRPRRIDLLVLSHPHIDHTRGKAELLTSDNPAELPYEILNVIDDGLNTGSGKHQQRALRDWAIAHAKYQEIRVRDIVGTAGLTSSIIDPVSCGDTDPKIRVLWGRVTRKPTGWSNTDKKDENNNSIVLRVDFGESSFLFPGDLMKKAEASLVSKFAGTQMLDVDVYQAGHHGSDTSSTPVLLQAMTPERVVIPAGDPQRVGENTARDHGHPRKVVVENLVGATSRTRPATTVQVARGQEDFVDFSLSKAVFSTGWDGNVVLTADSNGAMTVDTGN